MKIVAILFAPNVIRASAWASGNGYGIGDSLFLVVDIFSDFKIAIYNGFQSEKKYLYEQNSRLKTIKVITEVAIILFLLFERLVPVNFGNFSVIIFFCSRKKVLFRFLNV